MRKKQGDRSQLWRMNDEQQIEHEGSSPPSKSDKVMTQKMVLDCEKHPVADGFTFLTISLPNPQRRSTQKWKFTDDGRLVCEHKNLCVQPHLGLIGLRPGERAVLGPYSLSLSAHEENCYCIEHVIRPKKLRSGSGQLAVSLDKDGSTKVINIKDELSSNNISLVKDPMWNYCVKTIELHDMKKINLDNVEVCFIICYAVKNLLSIYDWFSVLKVLLSFDRGIGISILSSKPYEELVFITLDGIKIKGYVSLYDYVINAKIEDVQIDNQLIDSSINSCLLYVFHQESNNQESCQNAIELSIKGSHGFNEKAKKISEIMISIEPIALNFEEQLVLKLLEFFSFDNLQDNFISVDDYLQDEAQIKNYICSLGLINENRYSISQIQIHLTQIKLSLTTSSSLSSHLLSIKKKYGLTFVKLEDAIINFEKFIMNNQFETLQVYINSLKMHYLQELKWQAAIILGSVDFLGDPIGFANDITEGFSGLLFEGSVKSLVKNVTHGISNSAAKFTLTLSKGLEKVIPDDQYAKARQKILESALSSANPSSDHLMAGLKGFGLGIFGGATSIFLYSYTEMQNKGIQGLISGIGKGVVGTVTKPLIGILDLTSETAHAVKESSRSPYEAVPNRKRLPRCTTSLTLGLLPRYSTLLAIGQQHLYVINQRNFKERLLIYEANFCDKKRSKLRLIATTEKVWIFSKSNDNFTIVCSYRLEEIISCHPLSLSVNSSNTKIYHYIEFCLAEKQNVTVKRPRVRCQSEEMAKTASRQVSTVVSVSQHYLQLLLHQSRKITNIFFVHFRLIRLKTCAMKSILRF